MSATIIGTPQALPPTGIVLSAYGRLSQVKKRWLVTISEPDYNGDIIAALASPVPTSSLDPSTGLYCLKVGADLLDENEGGTRYIVWAQFSNDPVSGSALLPWQRKARMEWPVKGYDVPLEFDYSNPPKAVVNAVGDRPSPPIMHTVYNPLCRVNYCRLPGTFNPLNAVACQGSINMSAFTIQGVNTTLTVPAKGALLRSIVPKDEVWLPSGVGSGQPYYDIVLEIELKGQYPPNDSTHTYDLSQVVINNVGFHCYPDATTTPKKKVACTNKVLKQSWIDNPVGTPEYLTDESGEEIQRAVSTPVFLNPNGTRMSEEDIANTTTILNARLAFIRAPILEWGAWMR